MAIRLASYLKQNRFGVYYFRRVVPPDLQPYFAFRQIARSTRTSRLPEARGLALRFGASVELLFSRLRDMKSKRRDSISEELIVRLDFEPDGTLKSVETDAQPHEAEAASRIVPELIRATRGDGRRTALVSTAGPRLWAEIDKYLDEQDRGGVWVKQSALDIRGDFNQFKAVLGDIAVSELSHERLNEAREKLMALPANMNKMPETRGKSVTEILTLGLPPQNPSTARKKWGRLITFFNWLEGKGLVERNYARGKKPAAKRQSYKKFTNTDLVALFESVEYREHRFAEPFQFWLPLLGAYTGARLEELAQLHLADVRCHAETGIHVLEITEEIDEEDGADTEKRLKTDSSTRLCPVHKTLIASGFLDYADDLRRRGYDRLFPELVPDSIGKVGPRASEWFTVYRRSKGVGALKGKSQKVFHSFRHTLNTTLQRADIRQEVREALCGHSSNSINVRVYGDTLLLRTLKDSIDRADYGIAVPRYESSSAHERARQKAARRKGPS